MRNKTVPSVLLIITLVLGVLTAVLTGCGYVTGEAIESPASPPQWVWSSGNGEFSIVVDRQTHEKIRDVTPEEAFGIIYSSSDSRNPVVIDVRTPQEFADGYIRGALNIDYDSPDFKEEIDKLNKNKTYIVYCRSGKRSAAAQDIMMELDFRNVINMTGGIIAWQAEGLPVVQ